MGLTLANGEMGRKYSLEIERLGYNRLVAHSDEESFKALLTTECRQEKSGEETPVEWIGDGSTDVFFTADEIHETMRSGRSGDLDEIPMEFFKITGDGKARVITLLVACYNKAWITGMMLAGKMQ
eukprot:GHVN01074481.1.p1 GENE.GHVN01074481.1~~GHVN01074481.1.p1  ORF type:complete len:125 (+),score=14.69 GHVN01074481.1:26-400(+)